MKCRTLFGFVGGAWLGLCQTSVPATYNYNLPISPESPNTNWTQVLRPGESAQLTIDVKPNGVGDMAEYILDGPPVVIYNQTNPAFAWTADEYVFSITNSGQGPAVAVVTVSCEWRGGSGEIDGDPIPGSATGTALTQVVEVEKLRYRIGSSNDWTDVPKPLRVAKGTIVDFLALPKPFDGTWPSGKPVWVGATGPSNQASHTFDTMGSFWVTAECGNVVTGTIMTVEIAGLQYRIGSNAYVAMPDPLYVGKDTTVEFLALPNPASNWPAGKPAWTGADGGADGKASYTYNMPGTNYLVMAECGNAWTARVIVPNVVIKDEDGASPPKNRICITAGPVGYKAVVTPGTVDPSSYAWSGGTPILDLFSAHDQQSVSAAADDDNTGTVNINVVVTVGGVTCQAEQAVTVIKPTGETTSPDGWGPTEATDARFMMQIDPTGAFYSAVSVKEGDNGLTDTCYFPNPFFSKREHTDESNWDVNETGGYGPDFISWSPEAINFYRAALSVGGVSGIQIMWISRPASSVDFEIEQHFIEAKFDLLTITSTRDGHTLTKDY